MSHNVKFTIRNILFTIGYFFLCGFSLVLNFGYEFSLGGGENVFGNIVQFALGVVMIIFAIISILGSLNSFRGITLVAKLITELCVAYNGVYCVLCPLEKTGIVSETIIVTLMAFGFLALLIYIIARIVFIIAYNSNYNG